MKTAAKTERKAKKTSFVNGIPKAVWHRGIQERPVVRRTIKNQFIYPAGL